jgi:hypothetical protein
MSEQEDVTGRDTYIIVVGPLSFTVEALSGLPRPHATASALIGVSGARISAPADESDSGRACICRDKDPSLLRNSSFLSSSTERNLPTGARLDPDRDRVPDLRTADGLPPTKRL